MNTKMTKDGIAQILIEALFQNDEVVCNTYQITTRTLRNYRRRLVLDAEISEKFHTKRKLVEAEWAKECPGALVKALNFLNESLRSAGPQQRRNPDFIRAVTEVFRVVAEVHLTGRMIDAQIIAAQRGADDDSHHEYPQALGSSERRFIN